MLYKASGIHANNLSNDTLTLYPCVVPLEGAGPSKRALAPVSHGLHIAMSLNRDKRPSSSESRKQAQYADGPTSTPLIGHGAMCKCNLKNVHCYDKRDVAGLDYHPACLSMNRDPDFGC
jgi:hypothetical protein